MNSTIIAIIIVGLILLMCSIITLCLYPHIQEILQEMSEFQRRRCIGITASFLILVMILIAQPSGLSLSTKDTANQRLNLTTETEDTTTCHATQSSSKADPQIHHQNVGSKPEMSTQTEAKCKQPQMPKPNPKDIHASPHTLTRRK